ncbi:MAG TPA: T9SS type A sorting domain-containing protein, partial [Flavipsychrobacter sp.]|nr:T9SS type A sorting domain-containing protein [Flavipsychrobacter sp.]
LSVGNVVAANTHCMPVNGVLTLSFSPKYTYGTSSITPSSQSGNSVSWNLSALSGITNPAEIVTFILYANGNYLTIGDTVHTNISITPTLGDVNIANNMIVSEDTVTGPYDPNAIYVEPGTCVTPGTRLKYTVTFENLGNAPAQNIHVMDTLSAGLDFNNVKIIGASHTMLVSKLTNGGYNVLKFEFPGINLPGSTSPDRHGFVMYTAEMTDNFPIGSSVTNKAGIYFDYMPAVLTNVAATEACWPADVKSATAATGVLDVYPNPASDKLFLNTSGQFTYYSIANSVGQVLLRNPLQSKEERISIKDLPAGIYSIKLEGSAGTEVRSFVKM